MGRFDTIAFDADDTLWHNERLFVDAQRRLKALLAVYHEPEWVDARLYEAETKNLPHFGYGIKGFALSMIETAVELSEGRITGHEIQSIVAMAKEMLAAEVELLDHVAVTVEVLSRAHPLMLITKGDLRDQRDKLARSGLAPHFRAVEVVADKDLATYMDILARHGVSPSRFLFVGNSLRSDILPVLELGGHAVWVPYELTWSHEQAREPEPGTPRYHRIAHLGELPPLLARLEGAGRT